jgi:hypothetical protein
MSGFVIASIALMMAACGGGAEKIGEIDFAFVEVDTPVGISMVAVGENTAWFKAGGDLVPVDARTREVGEPIGMPDSIAGMVADGDDVWVAFSDETLRRYDPTAGTLGEPYDYIPDDYDYVSLRDVSMAVVDGAVWIELVARLVAVDIETGELRADIAFDDLISIAGGSGEVWVSGAGKLVRIDAASGEVTGEVTLAQRSGSIAAGHGEVWMSSDAGIHRVDAGSMAPIGDPFTYAEDEDPSQIVLTPDGLWATLIYKNQVVKVDPDTGEVTDRYELRSPYSSQAAELRSIAYGAGAIWVTTEIGNRAGFIELE